MGLIEATAATGIAIFSGTVGFVLFKIVWFKYFSFGRIFYRGEKISRLVNNFNSFHFQQILKIKIISVPNKLSGQKSKTVIKMVF